MQSVGSLPGAAGILLPLVLQGTPRLLGVANVTAPKGVLCKFWHPRMLIRQTTTCKSYRVIVVHTEISKERLLGLEGVCFRGRVVLHRDAN